MAFDKLVAFQDWVTSAIATLAASVADDLAALPRYRQVVSVETGAVATGTTIIPADDTIPQVTEGDQYMSLTMTPLSATSTLEIEVLAHTAHNNALGRDIAVFRDGAANAIASAATVVGIVNAIGNTSLKVSVPSSAIAETTFTMRAGSSIAGTTTFNGSAGVRRHGGSLKSSITVREYE